jgi:hypothetical protein
LLVASLRGGWRDNRAEAVAHLSAWLLLLFVLTPLYAPYLRLVLPLLGAAWLSSGQAIDGVLGWVENASAMDAEHVRNHRPHAGRMLAVAATSSLLIASAIWALGTTLPIVWREDRRGLERVAANIQSTITPMASPYSGGAGYVIYVYGEPALLFHLRCLGAPLVLPVETLELEPARVGSEPLTTFLAWGLHAEMDPQFPFRFQRFAGRYEPMGTYPYEPSSLVLLDLVDPRTAERLPEPASIRLYRLR